MKGISNTLIREFEPDAPFRVGFDVPYEWYAGDGYRLMDHLPISEFRLPFTNGLIPFPTLNGNTDWYPPSCVRWPDYLYVEKEDYLAS